MRNKSGKTRGFRPSGTTEKWIERLEKLNVNISDFVNKVLTDHIAEYATVEEKQKRKELLKVLDSPTP